MQRGKADQLARLHSLWPQTVKSDAKLQK